MENILALDENYGLQSLCLDEQRQIEGGIIPSWPVFLAIGAVAAAAVAIYEAGKATGEFFYHLIN